MKKNEQYNDKGLRIAVQRKNEAAEKMTPSEDFADRLMQRIEQQKEQPKHHRMWIYTAIGAAAAIALLFTVGVVPNQKDEKTDLLARTDTTKVTPPTETKKTNEDPLEKIENKEVADTVKTVKEILQISKPPRHYMAKRETQEEYIPEPDIMDEMDEIELAEKAMKEEDQRILLEMIAQTNGSLQADYQEMTREIRQRGERITQRVEIAISDDTY